MKKRWNKQFFLLIVTILAIASILVGCKDKEEKPKENEPNTSEQEKEKQEEIEGENEQDQNNEPNDEVGLFKSIAQIEAEHKGPIPEVKMTIKNRGDIIIHLYPDVAPNTVNSFISLIQDGYYDGLIFHRVVPNFVIQGGDPLGNGTGGPGYYIKGEFFGNGFENTLKHERGVLSMARSQDPDSAGSQFFIVIDNAPHLDAQYAAFGAVVKGMEIADEIVEVDRYIPSDKPVEDEVIESVTIDLKGYEPKAPEKIMN